MVKVKEFSEEAGYSKMVNDYRLEKIAREYEIVLFDSSALIDPFGNHYYKGKHNESICSMNTVNLQKKIDYVLFLQECLRKKYPFYVTKEVMEEINKSGGYAKIYKMHIRNSKYPNKRRVFVSPKTIERENREFNRLISLLVNNDRVIQFTGSETESYSNFSSDFFYLKGLEELSETDFDFLIKSVVLSNNRGKTAILTNDSGIRRAWVHLTKKQVFDTLDLVLFKSIGLEYFVESKDYLVERKKFRERKFLTFTDFIF